ncbi:uncharacterized protein [Chaetodon trifascialis]|uniref:uncharacterized protein n=1 Tax=Chaetodon trifascialis TaxID=109706 RepID=UPI003995229B
MDPQKPSLQFVRNREKIQQYLCELSEAKLTKQTQMNYLKSLKRFLVYHTVNTSLRREDETLHADCKDFIDYIGSLQKSCSKQVSKEITQKRLGLLTEKQQLTPNDCLAVLRAAKKDFWAVMGKVFEDKDAALELTECSFVVYYLQAVVQEWVVRQRDTLGNTVIGVKEHKTAAQQVATFALSQEEEFPLLTREKPAVKKVRVWPEGAMSALQDCFERREWSMFREAATDNQHTNVGEYAASVSGYIQWCMEGVTVTKTIITRANQKPWMTKESATIIPVPKKPAITCRNDFRPVALISTIMKCFERAVKDHIISILPPSFDLFQFTYQPNRSTEDAISTALHLSLEHLEEKNTHVRMLFLV